MARRFTVIQGGLSEMPAPAMESLPARAVSWRVDLRRPAAVDAAAVSAWRAMLVRNAVSDPLRDPDHLLPLAQHRPSGRRVAVALAWSLEPETGREALRGVVPLAMPHPVWGRRARPWQPPSPRRRLWSTARSRRRLTGLCGRGSGRCAARSASQT
ncbi:hypothetical protein ACRAWG_37555 [Methylobacterium sp. P31]